MKRARNGVMRTAGALAVVPVALAGLDLPALAGTALVMLIVVAALCWIISDADRTGRLAMLIDATRSNGRRGQRALPAAGSERREVH